MHSRRQMIGALAAGTAAAAPTLALAAPRKVDPASLKSEADISCLYHCDFGDPQRFSQMLQNMLNHYSAYDDDSMRLKLVIVAHGPGMKFFLSDLAGTPWENDKLDPDLFKRFEGLSKYGAEAYLCRITLARSKIEESKVRDSAALSLVPSGVAAVGELQKKGFAYLKVG